jgi:hypothetical protein
MTHEELQAFCNHLIRRFPQLFKIRKGISSNFVILEAAQRGRHLPILRPAVRLYNDLEDGQALTNMFLAMTALDLANNYNSDYNTR